ncbi:MAG: hypothetical protein U0931_26055 [Vulcanimicrobiota bacterium]
MLNRRHLVPLALLLTLFGCGGRAGNMKAKEYKGHFEDPKQGLIFQCPTTWDIRENVEGHRVIARSPREGQADKFQENLVVSGPVAAASLEAMHTQAENEFKKLDHYQAQAAPPDILDFDYEFKGQALHARAYLSKVKDKNEFWLAQFTDDKGDFPTHEAVFVQIMSSWGQAPGSTPTPIVNTAPSGTPEGSPTPPTAATATPSASATPAASLTPAQSPPPPASATPARTPTPVGAPTATPTPK